LDLRNEPEIAEFANYVKDIVNKGFHLNTFFHNAGMVLAAPVENMPLESVREVFEVNYFGIYSLTQKLIPLILNQKSNIFINSSMAGRIGLPFFSPYVSSKFAIEGFSESLRREMKPFGVHTVLFEPGAVATPLWDNSWNAIKSRFLSLIDAKYKSVFETAGKQFVQSGNNGLSPEGAANIIYKAMLTKNPKPRYIISKALWMDIIELLIPTRIMDKLIAKMFHMEKLEP
jgi:short-subunit dehydrogenase